jgi:hypothetical protein
VALVWENADGLHTVEQLSESLQAKLGIAGDQSVVLLALEELDKAGLPELKSAKIVDRQPSRRQVGLKLALTGLSVAVLPAIASVRSPTPGMASSHTSNGGPSPRDPGGFSNPDSRWRHSTIPVPTRPLPRA